MDSIALVKNMDIQTTVDWIAQKKSWLASGSFKAGALARTTSYDKGIVKVQIDETA